MTTAQQDFNTLTSMITSLEQKADSGTVDRQVLTKYQAKLDEIASKYQYDETAGSQRFELYELQAMILNLNGRTNDAQECLTQATELMSPNDSFVSLGARKWLSSQVLLMSEGEEGLRARLAWDGKAVRVIGWLGLILSPLDLKLVSGYSWSNAIAITILVMLPIALWFEFSGSYIQHAKGKLVGKFLVMDALLMLILLRALLPLLMTIELFITWRHLRKLDKSNVSVT